ncbi:MAG: M23 family metallopeptidase [Novosphingobium sp.]|nr:M23 family metallopeptidase [Novosphingobium sp.]
MAAGTRCCTAFAPAYEVVRPLRSPPTGLERWRARTGALLHRFDLAPDLAEDIGSRRWLRGLATMFALACVALALWPDLSAVQAAPAVSFDRTSRDEFRSMAVAPLALGGGSGHRVAGTALIRPIAAAPERPSLELVATLGAGDSFATMLQRAGVSAGDAARAESLVAAQVPLGSFVPGTRFDLTLGKRSAPGAARSLDKLSFRARFDLDLAVARLGSELVLVRQPITVDAMPLRITGLVGPSLYRSARAAGAPVGAVQQYLQTLDAHLSLDELAPDDRFDFIVGYKRAASGESETGALLYAGLQRAGKPLVDLLRWGDSGQFSPVFGSSEPQQTSGTIWPVNGHITSGFGMRYHPILGYTRMHAGVDFGAAWGSPIFAVGDGLVSYAGWHGGHGNFVRLEHGGGFGTGYGHMSRIAVAPGMRVHTGEVIGYVGATGLATGPHLHYEVYENGRVVDPLGVHFAMHAQVDPQQRSAIQRRYAELMAIRPGAALGPPPRQHIAFRQD